MRFDNLAYVLAAYVPVISVGVISILEGKLTWVEYLYSGQYVCHGMVLPSLKNNLQLVV